MSAQLARIRFLKPHLLWSVGEVVDYIENLAIELVLNEIAEFVDEESTQVEAAQVPPAEESRKSRKQHSPRAASY